MTDVDTLARFFAAVVRFVAVLMGLGLADSAGTVAVVALHFARSGFPEMKDHYDEHDHRP